MTVMEIVREAEDYGIEMHPDGDQLRVRAKRKPPENIVEKLRSHKPDIIPFLLDREAVVQRAECILTENAAIREGKFPLPEMATCTFHIGASGKDCKRCGGSWLEHYAPPSPSVRTKRGTR